ncbi:hypothetical protein DV736_g3772, partial [Chaetothyriales sp. CBS 134916]
MSTAIVISSSPPAPFARSPTVIDSSPLLSPSRLISSGLPNLKLFKSASKARDGFLRTFGSATMAENQQPRLGSQPMDIFNSRTPSSEILKAKINPHQAANSTTAPCNTPMEVAAADNTGRGSSEGRKRSRSPQVRCRRTALQRRTDWTPVKDDAVDRVFDLDDVLDPTTTFPKGLLARFEHIRSANVVSDTANPSDDRTLAAKRRKVDLVDAHTSLQNARKEAASQIEAQTKPRARERCKAAARKPMTITHLATSHYFGKEITNEDAQAMPCHSSTQLREAGITDIDDLEVLLKKTPQKTRRKSSKKKEVASKPRLLSPTSAIRVLDDQETIFGSASQLAQNQSILTHRNILSDSLSPEATQPTSIGSTTPGTTCGGTSKYVRRRNLWAAAGRDEDNALLHVETEGPFDLPCMRDAFAGKDVLVAPLQRPERIRQRPPAVTASPLPATKSGSQMAERVPSIRYLHTAVGQEEIEGAIPATGTTGTHQTRRECPSTVDTTSEQELPQKPHYAGVDTSVLQKRLKAYGFKPVKKREKMIELLDLCWEAKHGKSKSCEIRPDVPKHGDFLSRVHDVSMSGMEDALVEPTAKTPRESRAKKAALSEETAGGNDTQHSKPQEVSGDATASPPPVVGLDRRRGNALDAVEVLDLTELSDIPLSSQIQAAILEQSHDASLAKRNHVSNPTWHEKILMYDPIIIEDLTLWLNTEGLNRIGEDRERSKADDE